MVFDADCDSLCISYLVCWDSEGGYDQTTLSFSSDGGGASGTFTNLPVNAGAGFYDGTGALVETFCVGAPSTTDGSQFRFDFTADGAWSDEDGLWPTDGAVLIDSITVVWYEEDGGNWSFSGSYYEDFEAEPTGSNGPTANGGWTGTRFPGFGDFGALYQGLSVLQEDPCFTNFGFLWGFFDDPLITNYACHLPNPETSQGAFRFGPDANGLYLNSGIESPQIPNAGAGNQYILTFLSYRDLPLDNLQFYQWSIREYDALGCPDSYANDNFVFYGGQKDWLTTNFNIGSHVDPTSTSLQILLNAVDACAFWCIVFGTGNCHSHAPLVDQVHLMRVNIAGPQYSIRHLDLFQDTFAEDGTTTGPRPC